MAALSSIERRVIANLSIPRNEFDLGLMIRQDAAARSPQFEPADALGALEGKGYVVRMGQHESPGKLAAAVDAHPQALSMPDEKAQLFERRLLTPHRSWRARGDQWVMTQDGFDKLHDPEGVGDPTPLETWEVEQRIQAELARVYRGTVTDDSEIAHKLLEDEWAQWARQVADRHEELTGERPQIPMAGGAGYSDATELLILDPENGKGAAYTEAAPWFMAAVTVAVTDADTGTTITEANYTGYARKSVAAADMGTAAAGAASNVNAITFAACTAGTSAVIGFAKCAAATVGRLIKYGTCSTVNVSATQQPLNFAVGTFTTSLD